MHRYCAGVSVAQFEELSLETDPSSSLHALKPFMCLYCEQQAHVKEVELLKSVTESLKVEIMDLRDSIRQTIETETSSLSSSVVAHRTTLPARPEVTRSLGQAGRRNQNGSGRGGKGIGGGAGGSGEHGSGGCKGDVGQGGGRGGDCGHQGGGRGGGGGGGGGKGGGGGRGGGGTIGREMEKAAEKIGEDEDSNIESANISDTQSSQDNGLKVRVSGKRRIWGTLKASPAGVVKKSICNLTGAAQNMFEIKRKYKKLPNNKIRWWHMLTGNEDELVSLENKWEAVKIQTGWKIEPCYVHETFLINGKQPVT